MTDTNHDRFVIEDCTGSLIDNCATYFPDLAVGIRKPTGLGGNGEIRIEGKTTREAFVSLLKTPLMWDQNRLRRFVWSTLLSRTYLRLRIVKRWSGLSPLFKRSTGYSSDHPEESRKAQPQRLALSRLGYAFRKEWDHIFAL
jgi:hypothetical protein